MDDALHDQWDTSDVELCTVLTDFIHTQCLHMREGFSTPLPLSQTRIVQFSSAHM